MKKSKLIIGIVLFYVIIPFVACLPGLAIGMFGLDKLNPVLVPMITLVIYGIYHKSINLRMAVFVNGIALISLVVIFTGMMIVAEGNLNGVIMSYFDFLLFPFAPCIFIMLLVGQNELVSLTAFSTYAVAFVFTAKLNNQKAAQKEQLESKEKAAQKEQLESKKKAAQEEKLVVKEKAAQENLSTENEVAGETRDVEEIVTRKINFRNKKFYFLLLLGVVCALVSTYFYCNRPSVKYGGHGFTYMNGFSSTDFKDYMVYSENSKLVTLDHEPEFVIDRKEDMPILDGAEACYPLYAAFAKAVYKDIDQIELSWKEENNQSYKNGEVVTFTNTILGIDRLIFGASEEERQFDDYTDLFFGARPSGEQFQMAEENYVELEVTPIGKEGFVFFVEEDNPIEGLTSEEIKDIYSGKITNWKELGGKDEEIVAFQRPGNSGSQTMMEYFMGDVPLKEAKKYEMVSAMEGVIRQVAQYHNEKGAMGYSFRYFLRELNQEKGVKMLAVDGVYPSLETIADGTYPLTTSLCVISRKDDPNPYVKKMIDFILSEDGQYIIKETGYAPLN